MTLFESVMGTVNTAVDTISTVAQTLVEKNRVNAKLNRLRLVMKNESELMNRAYIALGKHYYENAKTGDDITAEERKKLFEVIETSKAKIAKARDCYRKIVDSQNDVFYGTVEPMPTYKSDDVVDITVACSNENEYESSPFENQKSEEVLEQPVVAEDAVAEVVKTVANKVENAAETVKTVAEKVEEAVDSEVPQIERDDDNESPDSELF